MRYLNSPPDISVRQCLICLTSKAYSGLRRLEDLNAPQSSVHSLVEHPRFVECCKLPER